MARDGRLERIRRSILREWRGGDDPVELDDHLHRATDFLGAILREAQVSEGIDEERLREMWVEIAGDFISRHASPDSLRGGCLTLKVLQPAMRFQLEQMKPRLLANLERVAGKGVVKSIRFSLG
ncbi:DUF721 domain-containing protein [Haloferula sp. A504]|jgi:predicted nucleic acid-binding Zn ribbon protein|uniref:DUF721 domain-containing protein n=1 Tax=Haloferula sp. A504 TaxID=3373601 RepID=UPI0031C6E1BB|nr:DUF721 domain-containing protein [Verrucomicrobiaceae bacterium E54]